MMPSAPGLVSMRIGWPSCWLSGCVKMRAPSSAAPPGGKGTMRRIGLLGYWAKAAEQARAAAIPAKRFFMVLLRLNASVTNRLAPDPKLFLDHAGHLLGCGATRRERLLGETLTHIAALKNGVQLAAEALDNLLRHFRWADHAGPGHDGVLRKASLHNGGHVRQ